MRIFLTLFLLVFTIVKADAQTITLDQRWESKEQLPVPESVLFVPERKELFVSLIDGEGAVKDGKGGVAILNLDGSLKNATWVTGLNAPKGMGIYKNRLYVADITEVVVIDMKNGKITSRIEIPDAVFLNDLTVDDKGVVYVSDSRANKIYQLKDGKHSVYVDNMTSANGLKHIGDYLYALVGPQLLKIDKMKNIEVIAKDFEKGGDGLEPIGNGDFLVTCWAGLIYYVHADGSIVKLLDVQGKMNTADLGYDMKNRMLYVPTFNSNSVVAYKLN